MLRGASRLAHQRAQGSPRPTDWPEPLQPSQHPFWPVLTSCACMMFRPAGKLLRRLTLSERPPPAEVHPPACRYTAV